MRVEQLGRVDLNLLRPLAVLLEERHVSRAAARLNLSQPATSRALQRLRDTFHDELLVRGANGYELTPRGERLRQQLAFLLPQLEAVIVDEPFDPAANAATFRVTAADYSLRVVGSAIATRALRHSPRSRFLFRPWHDRVFDDVERGTTDLAFRAVAAPRSLRSEPMFEEPFFCVMAADHPMSHYEQLTLDDYLACMHISIDLADGGQPTIERRLSTLVRPRAIGLTLPFFTAAPLAAAESHLVATLPGRLAIQHAANPALRLVRAPAEIESMTLRMVWHPRLDDDPAQRWLRDTVRAVTAPLRDAPPTL
jgi:DNA-binding transcriptional LysR family regulator